MVLYCSGFIVSFPTSVNEIYWHSKKNLHIKRPGSVRDASGHWEWFDWKKRECLFQINLLGEIPKRCSKVCLFFQYNRGWLFCNAKDDTHRGTAGFVRGWTASRVAEVSISEGTGQLKRQVSSPGKRTALQPHREYWEATTSVCRNAGAQ